MKYSSKPAELKIVQERITSQIGRGNFSTLATPVTDTATANRKVRRADSLVLVLNPAITFTTAQLSFLSTLTNRQKDTCEAYWYHTDHLGSSSWVTFSDGKAVEHLHYMPWGEDFVRQRSTDWHAMYTFSAKEKDTETGYSYFGARYYSSDLSVWLSVDPMASKYPSLSPYVYCANNSVKLVDPNGETPRIYCETKGVGHAFITTGEGENTVIYTYGRYLGGGKGKSSANSLDPSGKGVLLRLEGKEAQRYIKHELKDKDAKCFEVTDASDANVDSYFNNLFASGRTLNSEEASYYDSNPNKYGTSDNARVIDKYDLLTNNCVSKTIAGAKAGGSKNKFLQKRYYISTVSSIPVEYSVQPKSPKNLQQYLQNCSQQKGSTIKEVTDIINTQF